MTSYAVTRSTDIAAPPERIHPLLDDFREWVAWSPWEDLDPDLERTYLGPEAGVGARYEWSGNKKAGKGTMEIIRSTPERIEIALAFLKPFPATSTVVFTLRPTAGGTEVTWNTRGEQGGIWGKLLKVVPMDKLLGKDMEKGLARLTAVAEATGQGRGQ